MRKNVQIVAVYLLIATSGFLAIGTLPFRQNVPAAEPVPEHEVTIDEVIESEKEAIEERKVYLDYLLESEEIARMAQIPTETAEDESESESWHISPLETETDEFEPISQSETETETESETPVEIFQPVSSMMPADLQAWTYAHCNEVGVDPFIIMAICERESCCISDIMGDNGRSYGMMQVQIKWIPDKLAAHGYTAEDMLKAQPNIEIGTEILKGYLETGNGLEWALMAYNGGPQSAGSPATQKYAAWVIRRADELRLEGK